MSLWHQLWLCAYVSGAAAPPWAAVPMAGVVGAAAAHRSVSRDQVERAREEAGCFVGAAWAGVARMVGAGVVAASGLMRAEEAVRSWEAAPSRVV